ncbi:reprolysin family propeptide domain-containing protein [Phthorimaea operculella]|nr:reprolysin family propeptide domain-containing protein [Phthorimaea operculella]
MGTRVRVRAELATVALLWVLRAAAAARFPDILPVHGWWSGRGAHDNDDGGGPGSEDIQVVYLPALLPREAESSVSGRDDDVPVQYNFDAFGRSFELQLVPNRRLLSPQFGVWSEDGQDAPLSAADSSCHFLHAGPGAVAALSACRDHALVRNRLQPLSSACGRRTGRTRRCLQPTPRATSCTPARALSPRSPLAGTTLW